MSIFLKLKFLTKSVLLFNSFTNFIVAVVKSETPLLTYFSGNIQGEEAPTIHLWGASGEGNPIQRIDELNKRIKELETVLGVAYHCGKQDKLCDSCLLNIEGLMVIKENVGDENE